jgi:hypothetical protein
MRNKLGVTIVVMDNIRQLVLRAPSVLQGLWQTPQNLHATLVTKESTPMVRVGIPVCLVQQDQQQQALAIVCVQSVLQESIRMRGRTNLEVLFVNRVRPTLMLQNQVLPTLAIKNARRVMCANTHNALLVALFWELQNASLIKNFAFEIPTTVG